MELNQPDVAMFFGFAMGYLAAACVFYVGTLLLKKD